MKPYITIIFVIILIIIAICLGPIIGGCLNTNNIDSLSTVTLLNSKEEALAQLLLREKLMMFELRKLTDTIYVMQKELYEKN